MPHRKLLALLMVAAAPLATGDVLLLDGVETNARTATSRPTRGMTMTRVETQFGTPSQRRAAIGDPPITRWDYPGFSVYFEYDHVIHAVAER